MNKSNLFIILICSFLGGILTAQSFEAGDIEKFFIFIFLWMISVKFLINALFGLKSWSFKIYILVFIFFVFGFARFILSNEVFENHISNYLGESYLDGCIIEEPDIRADKVKYILEVSSIFINDESEKVYGKIMMNGPRYPVMNYGDCLSFFAVLMAPEDFYNLDYKNYLSRYNVYSIADKVKIKKIIKNHSNLFFSLIYKFKENVNNKLKDIFSEPYNSLMAGIILGSRNEIDEELMQKFNKVGLTHILAISGYNIAIVIFAAEKFFSFLTRKFKVLFLIFFIFVFVVLTGATASVVRAALMGSISLLALFFGRNYYVFLGLFVSAFFMNLWNPKILVYDISFQLSFLATSGICLFSNAIERYLKWIPDVFMMRESIKMTLSAQVLALPIIIINFENLSLISPISNLFVLPFIPFVMIAGVLAIMSSFISTLLGNLFGFFGYLLLYIMLFLIDMFSSLPFASIKIQFGFLSIIVYYIILSKITFKAFPLTTAISAAGVLLFGSLLLPS